MTKAEEHAELSAELIIASQITIDGKRYGLRKRCTFDYDITCDGQPTGVTLYFDYCDNVCQTIRGFRMLAQWPIGQALDCFVATVTRNIARVAFAANP